DAVSIAARGRRFDIVSIPEGAALQDADGRLLEFIRDSNRLAAAARLWAFLAAESSAGSGPVGTGLVAVGGFAFDPGCEPSGPWAGFPAGLFRVPALAGTRVRGRPFATGDLDLLQQSHSRHGPRASPLDVQPVPPA